MGQAISDSDLINAYQHARLIMLVARKRNSCVDEAFYNLMLADCDLKRRHGFNPCTRQRIMNASSLVRIQYARPVSSAAFRAAKVLLVGTRHRMLYS